MHLSSLSKYHETLQNDGLKLGGVHTTRGCARFRCHQSRWMQWRLHTTRACSQRFAPQCVWTAFTVIPRLHDAKPVTSCIQTFNRFSNRLYEFNPFDSCNPTSIFYFITIVFGRPFVKRFALCYRSVVCLSVCDVGVLWPNGWMAQDETWQWDRPRPRPHCVWWGPNSPSPKRRHSRPPPIFSPCLLWPNGRPSQLLLSAC